MERVCRICGSGGGHRTFVAREMMYGRRDEFEYFLCSDCGCLQISEIPGDLADHYPADYYSYSDPGAPRGQGWKRWLKRRRSMERLGRPNLVGRLVGRLLGPAEIPEGLRRAGIGVDSRILDVGCGSGILLVSLQQQGFSDLTGVDPYVPRDSSPRLGVRILKRHLADLGEAFDLLMLHHSFEHVPRPLETLRLLRERMRPSAALLIRIPVFPSQAWGEYGTDWVQLDAPRHLHLFSRRSMEVAAATAGLVVESVVYDSTDFQFWGSEQYRRGIPLHDPRSYARGLEGSPFTEADLAAFRRRAAELNASGRGDQAAFLLRAVHSPGGGQTR